MCCTRIGNCMRYCSRCVIPDTRPNIRLDAEGVCNACRAFETRKTIDWTAREKSFREVVKNAKQKNAMYDCIVPVSGGKDSHWQVIRCLEYGLKPLAVTWKPPGQTELGRINLENLIGLGVDHLNYSINPQVERQFAHDALVRFGSHAIPMHLAIFSIPLRLAVNYRIPLIIWGENSAFEYGSKQDEQTGFKLDNAWVKSYGVTHGTTAADWVSDQLTERDLAPYFTPLDSELDSLGILAAFLGYYLPWDPAETFRVAAERGFLARAEGPRTGTYAFADIDDDFISVHHFIKWYKFGITRMFDNLSLEIRHGRISREQAVEQIRASGDPVPHEDIAKLCSYLGISVAQFFEIIERYRNPAVWKQAGGSWQIPGFLIADWQW